MKVELETIPVWDGLKSGSECFICDLMHVAEEDAVSYYLGPAIMVPEIRVVMNRKGFCPTHWKALADRNKAQSLSLTLDTWMDESEKEWLPLLGKIAGTGNGKKAVKLFNEFSKGVDSRSTGCLVCDYMAQRLERYVRTVAALWRDDSEFRAALPESKGFCAHHTIELAKCASEELDSRGLSEYVPMLARLLEKNLKRCHDDDIWLSQKYKSENNDKPWNGCEDAHKRLVKKLFAEGRVLAP